MTVDKNLEKLLHHKDSVYSLARQLLRDHHAAEDVVQKTWLAFLKQPPIGRSSLRLWLREVGRRFALRELRSRKRRSLHEQRASRSDRSLDTATIVERELMRRKLAEVVLRLSPTFREVILLRFFEGLPPRRIAAHMRIPVETVKTRIKRGLRELRRQWSMQHGSEEGAISGLAILAIPASKAGVFVGATVIPSMTGKLAIGSACLAIIGLMTLTLGRSSDTEEARPLDTQLSADGMPDTKQVSATVPPKALDTGGPAARDQYTARQPSMETTDVPVTVVVRGQVLDSEQTPVGGAELTWKSNVHGSTSTVNDREVGYAVGGLASGTWSVTVDAPGYRERELTIQLDSSATERIVNITLPDARLLPIRLVDSGGLAIVGDYAFGVDSPFKAEELVAVATLEAPGGQIELNSAWLALDYGVGHYHRGEAAAALLSARSVSLTGARAGVLELETADPVFVSVVLRNAVLSTVRVLPEAEDVTFVLDRREIVAQLAGVGLRVIDADTGAPIEGALVELHAEQYASSKQTETGKDGVVVLEHEPPGGRILKIAARDYAPRFRYVRLLAGEVLSVGNVSLGASVRFRAFVTDEAGSPVECGFWYREMIGDSAGMESAYRFSWRLGEVKSDSRTGQVEMMLPRGRILLLPSSPRFASDPVLLDTTGGWGPEQRIVLRSARTCSFDWDLSRTRKALVVVRDASQQPLTWWYGMSGIPKTLSLGSGEYTVELWSGDEMMVQDGFTVGHAGINLWLDAEGLRGRNE